MSVQAENTTIKRLTNGLQHAQFSQQFRCILYDKRGSGHSHLTEFHEERLHINRFFDDLEALPYLLPSVRQVQDEMWERLSQVTTPVLILYGYQDFEPITQACLLTATMPQAQVSFLNECGHVPWLEQPERCIQALETFLR